MEFDPRDWDRHYERLKVDYQTTRKIAYTTPATNLKDLNARLVAVEKVLGVMKESPMQYELCSSELARRQVVVENLKRSIGLLTTSDPKAALLMSSGGSSGTAQMGTSSQATMNPLGASDRALIQRQLEVMKMQDDVLLDIEKGVDRLHGQALEIKSETIQQNKMLDELDVHVDDATAGLRKETAHAEVIRDKTNTCYMYLCIVAEIVVLLILVFVMFV